MKNFVKLIVFTTLLSGCTSSKLVNEWKSPDAYNYEANKVIVIGMNEDAEIRRIFEDKVAHALEKRNIIAVKSVDFFETSFTDDKKSIEDLNKIESQLLEAGFDVILLAKITGQERKVTLVQSYRDLARPFQTFEDYYVSNQHIYEREQNQSYRVYNTETSVYCICPGKERALLWRGEVDVVDAERIKKNINDYLKTLIKSLEDNNLLIL